MSNDKRILAIIPARGGSQGVLRKNARPLGDKPLVAYMAQAAMGAKHLDRLMLSSEDPEILEIGKGLGLDIPYERPQSLSGGNIPLVAVARHALDYFSEHGENFTGVMTLQPTSPFITSQTIDSAVELWKSTDCDSVTAVSELENGHPYITKRIDGEGRISDFCIIPEGAVLGPRQKREKAFSLTGSFYLRKKELLLADNIKGHCLGKDSRALVIDPIEAVDINTELDFLFADMLVSKGMVPA